MNTPHSPAPAPSKRDLYARLDDVSLAAAHSFRRRLAKARSPRALVAIGQDIAEAEALLALRRESLPDVTYPESLPVSARREDIMAAIRDNQVVIIAGETGSGKTTQIPKMCLDLGRGVRGLIGHTQPRRLAARSVAERISDELGQQIGDSVGYAIRFDDRVSESTTIKLMTDGILLAELQRDRLLRAYDTIIIDEAHERSLNIDFLLGYLKNLLPKRPDLKIIITSATIDPERFAEHFCTADGTPAPIIEVSGRTYPVEIRYRPLEIEHEDKIIDIDPLDGLVHALEELMAEGDGDILCFFSGERDIRDAMEVIDKRRFKNIEVVPLFGRLSNEEQHRVFAPHAKRRIVLATNIAETSLTVPGIHYVIDTGLARISRYSTRTKVQRLPIEPISQASANQRSGRCGRVADGIAIRLYSEQDFDSRPEFTDPEILRTNLASVILQMASLGLGDIAEFPFLQAPDSKAIRDGLLLLHELGAISQKENKGAPQLSPIGRTISRIPVDPRLARMLVEADRNGCLDFVIIIVAALTIQDVRERPLDHQAQADQLHARFKDTSSDFLSYLKLWEYLMEQSRELSGNAFRKLVKREFLHYLRIREWQDLVRQLRGIVKELGWKTETTPLSADALHQSLLAGLLSHIGQRESDSKEFHGARGTRFMIFPGSALAKKPPQFIMAAELVDTSRLWARDVAAIDPNWLEQLAGDLLRHQHSEPHWSSKRGAAMVYQKSTLFGVTVVVDKLVPYHKVDPVSAREMFIRSALIDGQWNTHHQFFHDNVAKLDDVMRMEDKARRRDLVVDEDTLFSFYDQRLPESITTARHFDSWWKKEQPKNPDALNFDPAKLLAEGANEFAEEQFPDVWRQGSLEFELTYQFEPGNKYDGVTVRIPVPLLAGASVEGFDWLVPGLRLELVTELIRSLPKALRRTVIPAPDFAARAVPLLKPHFGSLREQLAEVLRGFGAVGINASDFDATKLSPHLRVTFAAIDKRGKIVDSDKELAALKSRSSGKIRASVNKAVQRGKQVVAPAATWTFETQGDIATEVVTRVDGQDIVAYPALVVTNDGVSVHAMPTQAEADAAMLTSTLTLLLRELPTPGKNMANGLPLKQRVAVEHYPHGGLPGLITDAKVAAVRDLLIAAGGPVRTPAAFTQLTESIKPAVAGAVRQMVVSLAPALVDYLDIRSDLDGWSGDAIDDMQAQLEFLLPPHALSVHGSARLRHLPRYLKAMRIRLDAMDRDPDRDADLQDEVSACEVLLEARLKQLPIGRDKTTAVKDVRWMLQELRVSLFAQQLGTAHPVSARRIEKAIAKLR
ncbi:ATP-dependent RNA helicase HrpB [Corynebacterium kalinowskii]|uniref:ATP-dependent RNA helicase HrpB n=1 Tax=Corynebacterium kalinowskii TaxID=2675216 RepID=A0A6B8VQR5_9CORY|nr:ATP-dependent RNA helicase HrpA [Corynebacterium kalinowskii]QGU02201.1 ATP-dependent RNA helicase HrpB [Corynebacterium kalinowskii]